MTQIIRRLEIDAGHRVYRHESKCAHLHGHRYRFDLVMRRADDGLDQLGRVIDFGVVKQVVGTWLDNYWDHAMLLNREDPIADLYRSDPMFRAQRHYVLPFNPTAENLGAYLLVLANEMLEEAGVVLDAVTVHETPNCQAVVTKESAERIMAFAGRKEGDGDASEA